MGPARFAFDIVEFDWDYVWPVALILIGSSLVWRGFRSGLGRGADGGKDPGTRMSAFAVLGGVERRYTSQEFRGGDVTAIMGGCELDFRHAAPAPGGRSSTSSPCGAGSTSRCPRTGR